MTGRTAVVVGRGRGLGRAIAHGLAEQGADVIVADEEEICAQASAEIGAARRTIPLDTSRWDAIEPFVAHTYSELGKVDVLVNATTLRTAVTRSIDMDEAAFDATLGFNLKIPFRLSALFGDRMRQDGGGTIITVGSASALRPTPAFAVHDAAKGALTSVTRAHALEFGASVRVNAILAGGFETDPIAASKNALGRNARPDEIISTVLYLASGHSTYTTGTIITLDGGQL